MNGQAMYWQERNFSYNANAPLRGKKAIKNYKKSDSIICEPACHIKLYVTGRSVANLTVHHLKHLTYELNSYLLSSYDLN
ncbi:MAG: hypothetical protein KJ666_08330 [Bacteroidetes bacterium]|nr:hypothetical protein [Bacteroidota bacterium]MBU2584641.1 hypothetical protein [Bacteroidota bacterium]